MAPTLARFDRFFGGSGSKSGSSETARRRGEADASEECAGRVMSPILAGSSTLNGATNGDDEADGTGASAVAVTGINTLGTVIAEEKDLEIEGAAGVVDNDSSGSDSPSTDLDAVSASFDFFIFACVPTRPWPFFEPLGGPLRFLAAEDDALESAGSTSFACRGGSRVN